MAKKRFVCKEDGYNIYETRDEYGRFHFYAYLNRKQVAHEAFYINNREEKQMCIRFFVQEFCKRKPFKLNMTRTDSYDLEHGYTCEHCANNTEETEDGMIVCHNDGQKKQKDDTCDQWY